MSLVIFEDELVENLHPLTLTRPAFDLRCGVQLLWQKAAAAYPHTNLYYWVRDSLKDLVRLEKHTQHVNVPLKESALLINARVLWNSDLAQTIPIRGDDCLYYQQDTLVAARLSGHNLENLTTKLPLTKNRLPDLPQQQIECKEIKFFWDLLHENATEIVNDIKRLGYGNEKEGKIDPGVHLLEESHISLGKNSRVMPNVVINAEKGNVLIDEDVTIQPHSYIEGPCYIGKKSLIKTGAQIFEGCSFGEVCKIGGEIEESILLSYSNKQHDGFLGNAYLGKWVNIGADTNNSNLKNDYDHVKCIINGKLINTQSQFVGMAVGDHSRTGINTMFNTGTVVGVGCNIFGIGFPPKSIPSFTWGGAEAIVEYRLDKFLEAVRRVMKRRCVELSLEEEALLTNLYDATEDERDKARMMNRMKTS